MVRRRGVDPLPRRDGFYRPAAGAAGFAARMEPMLGDDPRSSPYQSDALPLCYMGEWRKVEASNFYPFRDTTG